MYASVEFILNSYIVEGKRTYGFIFQKMIFRNTCKKLRIYERNMTHLCSEVF